MKKLKSAIHAGRIETLVVWRLDRLGCITGETLRFLEGLEHTGVRFVTVRDHVVASTASRRLLRNTRASFAECEREVISERIRASIARARSQGKHLSGIPLAIRGTRQTIRAT
jgi:DNA invertase Pin-like site-specific DNA recombinase